MRSLIVAIALVAAVFTAVHAEDLLGEPFVYGSAEQIRISSEGDPDAAYLLVTHDPEGRVTGARVISGESAEAIFPGNEHGNVDVFRIDAIGTMTGPDWKPCKPDEDCTPTGGGPGPRPRPRRWQRLDVLIGDAPDPLPQLPHQLTDLGSSLPGWP